MAVIKPSLVFEDSHLGDRFNPNPGVYTARLHSFQTTPASDKSYQLQWVLTNYPSTSYRWIVKQWFPRKNPGFLSQMLCSWKHKKWGDLGENDDERLEALGKLIGGKLTYASRPWIRKNRTRLGSLRSGPWSCHCQHAGLMKRASWNRNQIPRAKGPGAVSEDSQSTAPLQ